jgi:hypothetical protein
MLLAGWLAGCLLLLSPLICFEFATPILPQRRRIKLMPLVELTWCAAFGS